mgnify:CR=1 FL=1
MQCITPSTHTGCSLATLNATPLVGVLIAVSIGTDNARFQPPPFTTKHTILELVIGSDASHLTLVFAVRSFFSVSQINALLPLLRPHTVLLVKNLHFPALPQFADLWTFRTRAPSGRPPTIVTALDGTFHRFAPLAPYTPSVAERHALSSIAYTAGAHHFTRFHPALPLSLIKKAHFPDVVALVVPPPPGDVPAASFVVFLDDPQRPRRHWSCPAPHPQRAPPRRRTATHPPRTPRRLPHRALPR